VKILLAWGLGIVLLIGLAVAGDAKDDLKKLEGTWKATHEGKKLELQFAKDKFTITIGAEGEKGLVLKGTVKLDPKKTPKEMDLTITEGKDYNGETALAVYDIDGDSLKWCANKPGEKMRPNALPDKEGETADGYLYLIFKRAK
jgi:uncharacterized protein (TIGR03067 family)